MAHGTPQPQSEPRASGILSLIHTLYYAACALQDSPVQDSTLLCSRQQASSTSKPQIASLTVIHITSRHSDISASGVGRLELQISNIDVSFTGQPLELQISNIDISFTAGHYGLQMFKQQASAWAGKALSWWSQGCIF